LLAPLVKPLVNLLCGGAMLGAGLADVANRQ
jgi:hypothetical protein